MWLATIALVCEGILLVWVGYEWGCFTEKKHQASRDEAIRAKAHKDGRKSMFEQIDNSSKTQMTDDDFRRMYMGTWTAPEQHETKESS